MQVSHSSRHQFPGARLAVDGGYRSIVMTVRKQKLLLPGTVVKRSKHRLGTIDTLDWCLELLDLGHLRKSSDHVLIVWFWFSPAVNVTKPVCNIDHLYSRKSFALPKKAGWPWLQQSCDWEGVLKARGNHCTSLYNASLSEGQQSFISISKVFT